MNAKIVYRHSGICSDCLGRQMKPLQATFSTNTMQVCQTPQGELNLAKLSWDLAGRSPSWKAVDLIHQMHATDFNALPMRNLT